MLIPITRGAPGPDTATVIVTVCSGIDNTVESQIAIFPNPFTDALVINIQGNYGKGYALLMDATGRQISRTEFEAGAMSVVLNTGAIANGAYLLNIMVDGKSVAVRKVFRME